MCAEAPLARRRAAAERRRNVAACVQPTSVLHTQMLQHKAAAVVTATARSTTMAELMRAL
jgi:hypothetical protein